MDDMIKAGGATAGLGAGAVFVILGIRIYNDSALTWFVVATGMGTLFCLAAGFAFHMFKRARQEDRAASASANEVRLGTARILRTAGTPPQLTGPQDVLSAYLAGVPGHEAVDGVVTYPDNGGHDDD